VGNLKYKDNAESLLTTAINNTDDPVTFSVTAGDGALFPSLSGSEWFPIVVVDSANNYEKMKVTSISTDTMTAVRAQGGTSKLAFAVGDAVYLAITAEMFDEVLLKEDAQTGAPQWLGTASGTADALTFTATPAITAYAAGMEFCAITSAANTGAMTIDVGAGAKPLYKNKATVMAAGDILADMVIRFAYDAVNDAFQLLSQTAVLVPVTTTFTRTLLDDADAQAARATLGILEAQGQCRLEYTSATLITLKPYNGDKLYLYDGTSWQLRAIPSAGVTLGNSGLSASTTYYVYAYDNAGTITLEASITGHAADTSTGFEIKSGDATRLLVGMVRTDASSQFQDGGGVIGVLSWFNRRLRTVTTSLGSPINFSTAVWFNLGGIYVQALSWSDEGLVVTADLSLSRYTNPTVSTYNHGYLGIGRNSTSSPSGPHALGTATYDVGANLWSPYYFSLSCTAPFTGAEQWDTFYLLSGASGWNHTAMAGYTGIVARTSG